MGFVDDFGLGGEDDADLIKNLAKLFKTMAEHNYKLGADKVFLGYTEVVLLGYLIKDGAVLPDPEKVTAIKRLLPPQTKTQVRAFLGITGYYRVFIFRYAAIAKPLTILLSDQQAWVWKSQQEEAFAKLKKLLMEEPILAIPEDGRQYFLYTDFCGVCLSAVLE